MGFSREGVGGRRILRQAKGKKRGRQTGVFFISKSILGVDIIQQNPLFGGVRGGPARGGQNGPFWGGPEGLI